MIFDVWQKNANLYTINILVIRMRVVGMRVVKILQSVPVPGGLIKISTMPMFDIFISVKPGVSIYEYECSTGRCVSVQQSQHPRM